MITAVGWIAALVCALWALWSWGALERRTELVARACHELRGPITAARLALELIGRENEVRPPALSAIDLELTTAGRALEDLSAAVTGRSGPWRIDAVDVTALLADSLEAFRPLALARGVELALSWRGAPQIVRADRVRLAQATGNLIANAIEHGEGRVELRGTTDEHGLAIEVTDDGPGLPSPVADLITRPHGGRGRRGRGLAIAADIAERHGGDLAAVADEAGSRVSLSLPLHDA